LFVLDRTERAVDLFRGGHACCQAVLLAWAADLGLDHDRAARLAAGFGGGMDLGATCGAVTGAIMVLGLALCSDDCVSDEGRAVMVDAVASFGERFRARIGAVDCPDIIGCDLRTSAGAAEASEHGLFASRCAPAVRAAAEILEDMLPSS
jgi:C_GCAxxG_C_C family probable redox protein